MMKVLYQPWVISLISSSVGIVLGFLLILAKDFFTQKRERKSAINSFTVEIKVNLKDLCADYDGDTKFISDFKKAKSDSFKDSTPRMNIANKDHSIVYRINFEKLSLFESDTVEKIVEFYDMLGRVRSFAKLLEKKIDNFYSKDIKFSADDILKEQESLQQKASAAIDFGNDSLECLLKKNGKNDFKKILPKNPLKKYSL